MIKDALFGVAVGDALGVPVEFKSRSILQKQPVVDMIGYGTHNQPPGTWSDDSSLTFCLAEALTHDFDLNIIAQNFVQWLFESYWTPHGRVFDIGISTHAAIQHLSTGTRPDLAGGFEEDENGNGSLMRILPLVFYIKDKGIAERYQITKSVSSITHGHVRSVIACFYYLEFARLLINKTNKFEAFKHLKSTVPPFVKSISITPTEILLFQKLFEQDIYIFPETEINSSGYVLHTLEASMWCLLTTQSYEEAVLKAVNLGSDTDTTAAVTGGLAGILYGFENIPKRWVAQLARNKDIEELANRLQARFRT